MQVWKKRCVCIYGITKCSWKIKYNNPKSKRKKKVKTIPKKKIKLLYFMWSRPWHISWHFIWHVFWHKYSHSPSDTLSKKAFYLAIKQFIWDIFWHSIWHFIWHMFWHPISHSIWQSIQPMITGILSTIYCEVLSGILSGILSDVSSDILSGMWSGILSDILFGILCGICSDIHLNVYLAFSCFSHRLSGSPIRHFIQHSRAYLHLCLCVPGAVFCKKSRDPHLADGEERNEEIDRK
jgi:hypothetical protein